MSTVTGLSVEDLEDALFRVAQGYWSQEAAVMLVAWHDHWLRRPAFRRHVRLLEDEPGDDPNGPAFAVPDWEAIVQGLGRPYDPTAEEDQLCQASGTERGMLAIAASIGGGKPVDLREALSGLDDRNLRIVQAAIVHASRGRVEAAGLWPQR